MLTVTVDTIAGAEIIQTLGLVRGATVRAKHIGTDIVAGFRNLVGGEIKSYSSLLAGAREQALDRMIEDARQLGADAVIGMRMETSAIMGGASEIVAYGTAVRLADHAAN
ncbi:MAG: YbjQ family protein [Rhodobacteraceae bacterium]|nr:YbjQ family protein [Paracoccaceae bacterium]